MSFVAAPLLLSVKSAHRAADFGFKKAEFTQWMMRLQDRKVSDAHLVARCVEGRNVLCADSFTAAPAKFTLLLTVKAPFRFQALDLRFHARLTSSIVFLDGLHSEPSRPERTPLMP